MREFGIVLFMLATLVGYCVTPVSAVPITGQEIADKIRSGELVRRPKLEKDKFLRIFTSSGVRVTITFDVLSPCTKAFVSYQTRSVNFFFETTKKESPGLFEMYPHSRCPVKSQPDSLFHILTNFKDRAQRERSFLYSA